MFDDARAVEAAARTLVDDDATDEVGIDVDAVLVAAIAGVHGGRLARAVDHDGVAVHALHAADVDVDRNAVAIVGGKDTGGRLEDVAHRRRRHAVDVFGRDVAR